MVDDASFSSSGQNQKLSPQEYLEQLRQRRLQRQQESIQISAAATPEPTPSAAINIPVHTPPTVEPVHAAATLDQPIVHNEAIQQPSQVTQLAQETHTEETVQSNSADSQPTEISAKNDAKTTSTNETPLPPESTDFDETYLLDQTGPMKEEVVLEWSSPSRPFKKRNRQFFSTIGIIALLLSMILFFAGQVLIIAVVISVVFLGYVLATVPPDNITHKITTYGINSDGVLYYWDELGRFWFDTKLNQQIVCVETERFPARLTLLLGDQPEDFVRELLSAVLLEEQPVPTSLEKMSMWLEEKIPLETT